MHKHETEDGSRTLEVVERINVQEIEQVGQMNGTFFGGGNLSLAAGCVSNNSSSMLKSKRKSVIANEPLRPRMNGFHPDAADNFELDGADNAFFLRTAVDGDNSGYHFCFKTIAGAEMDAQGWITEVTRLQKIAQHRKEHWNRLKRMQKVGRALMQASPMQLIMNLVIIASFITIVIETQLQPDDGSSVARTLASLDWAYLVVFTIELGLNLFSYWWSRFWKDGTD